jgi:hypothetical protein
MPMLSWLSIVGGIACAVAIGGCAQTDDGGPIGVSLPSQRPAHTTAPPTRSSSPTAGAPAGVANLGVAGYQEMEQSVVAFVVVFHFDTMSSEVQDRCVPVLAAQTGDFGGAVDKCLHEVGGAVASQALKTVDVLDRLRRPLSSGKCHDALTSLSSLMASAQPAATEFEQGATADIGARFSSISSSLAAYLTPSGGLANGLESCKPRSG